MTIIETQSRLRRREVSSVELTEECLRRIGDSQPRLNAFITVTGEAALEAARRCDNERRMGAPAGPLHGIPIALKDVFCTKGVRTTCGSALFASHVPGHDAAVAERLRAAGAVLLGKTGMHELAYGITSNNPHFGAVRNPWDPERIPGGSSGGSGAAVATGMAYMAMGSDTGGSIRIPASFCGVVGIKPTTGRVSRYGVLPLDFTLDHIGPLARSVRDAALTLEVIAGFDPRDESSSRQPAGRYVPGEEVSLAGLRVGVPENFFFDSLDPGVEAAVRRAVSLAGELGAALVPVRLPDFNEINIIGRVILLAEASAVMAPFLDDRSKFGPDVLALLDQGRLVPATDYINAQRVRRLMQRDFARIWRQVDCLMAPTTPVTPPRIGQPEVRIGGATEDTRIACTRLVRGFNVLGLPVLSLPVGRTPENLPIGCQIAAPPFREDTVFRLGAALEDAAAGAGEPRPVS